MPFSAAEGWCYRRCTNGEARAAVRLGGCDMRSIFVRILVALLLMLFERKDTSSRFAEVCQWSSGMVVARTACGFVGDRQKAFIHARAPGPSHQGPLLLGTRIRTNDGAVYHGTGGPAAKKELNSREKKRYDAS